MCTLESPSFGTQSPASRELGVWVVHRARAVCPRTHRGVHEQQFQDCPRAAFAILSTSFIPVSTGLYLVLTYHTTQTRHQIDLHLALHVFELTNLIRNWAVVLYFQPFATIRLDRMSAAFGWTVDEVEAQVVSLIQSGNIQGRVDSQNKVLFSFLSFWHFGTTTEC
jgi:PCI domain